MTQKIDWWEQVPCPDCGYEYTRKGMSAHKNSRKCKQQEELAPIRADIKRLETTVLVGKGRISQAFIEALQRRGIESFVGSYCASTKISWDQDGYYWRRQEWWADDWAVELYEQYLSGHRKNKIYDDMKKLSKVPEENQEAHRQLLSLKYVDIDG